MPLYIVAVMFFLVGALFAYMGYCQVSEDRRRLATWIHVDGTVIELIAMQRYGDLDITGVRRHVPSAPKFRYTVHGVERTATSSTASWPSRYKVGDTVRLVVNPENTSEADAVHKGNGYLFLAMGLGASAVGLLFGWLVHTKVTP